MERLRIERGENIAQMVVRRRAVLERPEATQKINLLLAEPRDIGEGLRSRQHGEQAQEQDLVERIDNFPGLSAIRHIFEIGKKSLRLRQGLDIRSARVHPNPLQIESEDSDRVSSNAACHLLLHPIALGRLARCRGRRSEYSG